MYVGLNFAASKIGHRTNRQATRFVQHALSFLLSEYLPLLAPSNVIQDLLQQAFQPTQRLFRGATDSALADHFERL